MFPLLRLAEYEFLLPVKYFGMTGMHFRATVRHPRDTIPRMVVDQAGPVVLAETARELYVALKTGLQFVHLSFTYHFDLVGCLHRKITSSRNNVFGKAHIPVHSNTVAVILSCCGPQVSHAVTDILTSALADGKASFPVRNVTDLQRSSSTTPKTTSAAL